MKAAIFIALSLLSVVRLNAEVPAHTITNGGVSLKGVGPDNPIIYDNDWWFDVFDNNYLWAQASLGKADLRGNIVSRDMWDWDKGYLYPMQKCVDDAEKALKLARGSGLKNIPEATPGSDRVLTRPESGRIEDTTPHPTPGSRLIVAEAKKASPEKPLLLMVGGPQTTVASALLTNPEIAPNLVAFNLMVSSINYNGLGKITLAAQIITPLDPKGVSKQSWQESAFWHYDRCLRSEMCMERIPEPIIGSIGAKQDPNSAGAKAYVESDPVLAHEASRQTAAHRHGPPVRHPGLGLPAQPRHRGQGYRVLRVRQCQQRAACLGQPDRLPKHAGGTRLSLLVAGSRFVQPASGFTQEHSDDWNDVSGDWAVLDNLKNVLDRESLPFIDDPYRDKFNCGGFLERLKRNHQYNSGHHHKGWGDDAYSDGNIFAAWQPAVYRNARLREVRGGQVIDHEYHLDWLDRRAIHAASYPFLSNPDAYRGCDVPVH